MESDHKLSERIYTRLSTEVFKAFKETCVRKVTCPSLVLRYAVLQYIARYGNKQSKKSLEALDEELKEILKHDGFSLD